MQVQIDSGGGSARTPHRLQLLHEPQRPQIRRILFVMSEQSGRLVRVQFATAQAPSANTVHEAAGHKRHHVVRVLQAGPGLLFAVAKRVRAYIDECTRFAAAIRHTDHAARSRSNTAE